MISNGNCREEIAYEFDASTLDTCACSHPVLDLPCVLSLDQWPATEIASTISSSLHRLECLLYDLQNSYLNNPHEKIARVENVFAMYRN